MSWYSPSAIPRPSHAALRINVALLPERRRSVVHLSAAYLWSAILLGAWRGSCLSVQSYELGDRYSVYVSGLHQSHIQRRRASRTPGTPDLTLHAADAVRWLRMIGNKHRH